MSLVNKAMINRKYKKEYEHHLGREICDQTWYRVRKALSSAEIYESNYPKALLILGKLKRNNQNLSLEQLSFLEIWRVVVHAEASLKPKMCCGDFRVWLEKGLTHTPPRSAIYRWFKQAGCTYSTNKQYPLSDLVCVAAFAKIWEHRKVKKIEADVADSILDCEFIEEKVA